MNHNPHFVKITYYKTKLKDKDNSINSHTNNIRFKIFEYLQWARYCCNFIIYFNLLNVNKFHYVVVIIFFSLYIRKV